LIPAPFTYQRASSVDEALDLAARGGEDAKFLAGGHSLLPLMKLRLAVPEILVDIGRLRELSYIRDDGSHIAVGAVTSHDELARSGLLASELPLLAHAAGQVGDPQVRHRGTIGGSLAHADPASDLPAVILALDAALVARGPFGSREIAAGVFFTAHRDPHPQAAGGRLVVPEIHQARHRLGDRRGRGAGRQRGPGEYGADAAAGHRGRASPGLRRRAGRRRCPRSRRAHPIQ
jgi:CO/xanthine dehydrogenase FAD-binding subunit